MRPTAAQRLSMCRRDLRVLWRQCRFSSAYFTSAGRDARTAALVRLFRTVNAHLAGLGVDYWINFGTLLGWHRTGAILARDRDVDFGAPVAAFERIWASRHTLPRGFRLFDTSFRHPGPKLYFCHQGWEADVYFYAEEQGRLHALLRSPYPSDTAPFPREWIYPLQPVRLHEAATFAPAQPEAWLRHTYGYIGPDAVRDRATGYFRPRRTAVSDAVSPAHESCRSR